MPYAEALTLTRSANNPSLAHRRAQKGNIERYHQHGYYPSSISIPSYGYAGAQTMSLPYSAPPHFTSPPMLPGTHHSADAAYGPDTSRRPPLKHMSTAPGGMYTLHGAEGSASWQQAGSAYQSISPADPFHPPNQEVSGDANPFWGRLSTPLTSPQTTDIHLPPPRPSQWIPNSGNNYTHERAQSSALPAPHHSTLGDVPVFQSTSQPQFYSNGMSTPVNHAFQSPPASHASAPQEDHCGETWPRSVSGYRPGTSI